LTQHGQSVRQSVGLALIGSAGKIPYIIFHNVRIINFRFFLHLEHKNSVSTPFMNLRII
jgi:hypothetical protein